MIEGERQSKISKNESSQKDITIFYPYDKNKNNDNYIYEGENIVFLLTKFRIEIPIFFLGFFHSSAQGNKFLTDIEGSAKLNIK